MEHKVALRQSLLLDEVAIVATDRFNIGALICAGPVSFRELPSLILTTVCNGGATTLDVTIEASYNGTDFFEVLAFAQFGAGLDGMEIMKLPMGALFMDAVVTLGGVGDYDVRIDAFGPASGCGCKT